MNTLWGNLRRKSRTKGEGVLPRRFACQQTALVPRRSGDHQRTQREPSQEGTHEVSLACGLGQGSVLEAHISGARQSRSRLRARSGSVLEAHRASIHCRTHSLRESRWAGLRPAPELLRCEGGDKAKRTRRSRLIRRGSFGLTGEVFRWGGFLFLRFLSPIVRRFPRATNEFRK